LTGGGAGDALVVAAGAGACGAPVGGGADCEDVVGGGGIVMVSGSRAGACGAALDDGADCAEGVGAGIVDCGRPRAPADRLRCRCGRADLAGGAAW
jgi:hypothetical protein